MTWIDRIVEATGASPEPRDIDWTPLQWSLGTSLPADFRELNELFGKAQYSGYLSLLWPVGESSSSLLGYWRIRRESVAEEPASMRAYEPYGLYGGPGTRGLLQWGLDQTEGRYYWLADTAQDPADWPVVAQEDPMEPWHRYEMGTSEFVYRVMTDGSFVPFSVAALAPRPSILAEGESIDTDGQWQARAQNTDGGAAD